MKKKYIIKKARKLLVEQINSHQTIVRNDMNNIETMSNMKGLSEVIPKDNDGYCTIYKMDCADGLGLMTVYQVFPGIQLIYNDFEATEYEWESILDKDILEINHCREGREGSRLLSGSCLYLGEGDLSIHTMDNCASEMSFPLKHYRGISVVINLTTVSKNSPEILMEAGIDILAFRNKFCASGDCFIMRAKDEIEHIFSELYSIPDCLQKPYMKLKVQELSGGMRQRVMIAIALACNPKILIADEPTTALDVTIQAQIMDLMRELKEKSNTAIILVTHDLGVVANFADRIQVMYAGQVVERGTAREIFYESKHPYTWALLSSVPKVTNESKEELYALKGTPPDLLLPLHECPFASRCEYCMGICKEKNPMETSLSDTHKVSCWLQHPKAPKVKSFYDKEAK